MKIGNSSMRFPRFVEEGITVVERFLSRFLGGGGNAASGVRVDPTVRYQTMEGWGTSLAWWGHVVGGWSDAKREEIADLVFNPTNGLGLTVARYNIGGGDDPTHHHMRPGGDIPGYQPARGVWDWNADANQRWVLQAARARGATVCEAFSNAPPYWMTRSGCAAGSTDGGDNLREEDIDTFAAYLAEVLAHVRDAWGTTFQTIEPFNEPSGGWWKTGNNQEGCHFSPDMQRAVIANLSRQLAARGLTATAIAVADENNIDEMVATFDAYDPATRALVAQINTHSYNGTRRGDLRERAAAAGKGLWMSEYGTGGGPHDHNNMTSALILSAQIRRDMSELRPASWVYWQVVEREANNNWGCIHADFGGSEQYWLTRQYYALAQYSSFIRPGYAIIGTDDLGTLAAYDASGTLVLVCDNNTGQDRQIRYDLSAFSRLAGAAGVYRTSTNEDRARVGDAPLTDGALAATIPAQSIVTFVIAA